MLTNNDLQKIGEMIDQKLDQKLKPINKKIGTMDKKIDTLNQKVKTLDVKVDSIETKTDSIVKKLDDLTEYVVPTIGSILKWTDDIHAAVVGKKSAKQIPEN
jgi:peptidoglycan hydrolase CwlO-like protein